MNYSIVLLAGSSTRFGGNTPKQFIKINGKMIVWYSLHTFLMNKEIDEIILVIKKEHQKEIQELIAKEQASKKVTTIIGGNSRQESTYNALKYLKSFAKDDDIVLIHDAARPLISDQIILDNIKCAKEYGAVTTAIPTSDTILFSEDGVTIASVPERKKLYRAQTPQSFKFNIILKAHEQSKNSNLATDDTQLVNNLGISVKIVHGDNALLKVTSPSDVALVESLLGK